MSKKEPGILLWIVGTRQKPPGEAICFGSFSQRVEYAVTRHTPKMAGNNHHLPLALLKFGEHKWLPIGNDCCAVGHVCRESFNQAVPNVGIYSACVFARYCGFRAI